MVLGQQKGRAAEVVGGQSTLLCGRYPFVATSHKVLLLYTPLLLLMFEDCTLFCEPYIRYGQLIIYPFLATVHPFFRQPPDGTPRVLPPTAHHKDTPQPRRPGWRVVHLSAQS